MSKGGGGGSTTTVQKADPWSGVTPYLTGDGTDNNSGIYQQAQNLYRNQGWTQGMTDLSNTQQQNVAGRSGQVQQAYDIGNSVLGGQFDPNISRVGNIGGAGAAWNGITGGNPVSGIGGVSPVSSITGVGNINAQSVDPTSAWGGMGIANPSVALSGLLSGQVNTGALDPVVNNATARLTQNFNEQVMPSLRSGAQAAGQYGSSRQGIAEGLAAKGLSQSIGDMTANLYNNAYQQAQGNMASTANNLSGLGLSNAQSNAARQLTADTTNNANQLSTQQFNANLGLQNNQNALQTQQFNANLGLQNNAQALDTQKFNASGAFDASKYNASNDLAAQQFNANLGLQNNSQAMQAAQQQLANRSQGLNLIGVGNSLQDQNYQQQMGLLNAPNDYNWQNLNRYASIIQPGSGIGGSSSSTSPLNTNTGANMLGGALAGAQLGGLLGIGGGMGAGLGALAMLSDRRMKTDIEAVGKLDNGLTVYRYRYLNGGPAMLGVMADEVKQMKPDAVITRDGVDYVNYGAL